jgi:hypothetical protein
LPAREKGQGGGDGEIHTQHQKIDQDGHLLKTNLPPPAAHTSNEPNVANLVGCGWFWTTRLCGWAVAGEIVVFNIIFSQKNIDYKTNTHLLSWKTPRPLLQIIQKQGREKGWLFMQRRL